MLYERVSVVAGGDSGALHVSQLLYLYLNIYVLDVWEVENEKAFIWAHEPYMALWCTFNGFK